MKFGVDNVNCPVKTNKWGKDNAWRNIKEIKCGVSNAWRSVWKRAAELIRTFTTKADFDTCALTDTVATSGGDVELTTGKTTGTAESPAINLSPAGAVETSKIDFATTTLDMGKALSFDGVDDEVTMPSSSALKLANTLTVEGWIYPTAQNNYSAVVIKGTGADGHCNYLIGQTDTSGEYRFRLDGSGYPTVTVSGISLNKWTHIAGVYDGSNVKVYVNGELGGSMAYSGSIATTDKSLVLGHDKYASTSRFFKGIIDEVRIWNTARTQAQIQNNMNAELIGNESGLVGYWKLNEGTGATANDSTSNNNDGTISGAIWTDGRKTTATVQTALSTDGGTTYGSWQTATSGAAIPGLAAGADVSNTKMKWKTTLSTNDASVTPKLHDVTVKLNEGM